MDPLADTLQPAKTDPTTLRNVRVEALVDTFAETVPDAKAKTPLDTLSDKKAEAQRTGFQTLWQRPQPNYL